MENNLSIYNTLSRKKEVFTPTYPGYVGLYVCGPTVYNDVHLGNVRTFLNFDIVYRYLQFLGYKVRYVRNITDVGHLVNDADAGEDKIAKKAKLENLEPMEIVQLYTNRFHDVMRLFNIQSPNIEPSATGHIIEQIEMVQRIIQNGFAYVKNGSVYFDVLKYNKKYSYGKLSGRVIEDLLSNTRDLEGQDEKNNPLDFAIWKAAEKNHIMRWNSPWGQGFPGWHLECSVMSTKYLSQVFDIHGGGMDLKFPHHECEIAQSVAADGKEPVRYWMHANMLTVNGRKMAKSEGNGFTPDELITGNHALLERGYSPMTVRFFMLQCHYTSTLDFSNEALQSSEKGFQRLTASIHSISKIVPQEKSSVDISNIKKRAYDAMNDDFNTPILISVLFDASKIINNLVDKRDTITKKDLDELTSVTSTFMYDVLGLKNEEEPSNKAKNTLSADLMETIIYLRNEAKKGKDFSTADKIRENLTKLNITLKDTPNGTEWEIN